MSVGEAIGDPSRPTAGTRDGVRLERSVCVQAGDNTTLSVGQLREMLWHLPDESPVLVDGKPVAFATPYGGVCYLDTGMHLPPPCSHCGGWGCGCLIPEDVMT